MLCGGTNEVAQTCGRSLDFRSRNLDLRSLSASHANYFLDCRSEILDLWPKPSPTGFVLTPERDRWLHRLFPVCSPST